MPFDTVVKSVTQSQRQITSLQTAMANMAEDHLKSQEALIAWTQDCIAGLMAQNLTLSRKLEDSYKHINNLSHNIQGYADRDFIAQSKVMLPAFDATPPGLYCTITPKIIKDPYMEMMGSEDPASLFPTATGAVLASQRDLSERARQGGPITLVQKKTEPKLTHRKSEEQRMLARALYLGVKWHACPTTAKGRWQWAIRKILFKNKLVSMKVGLVRGKVPSHDTLVARLHRAETELFRQPIAMKEHVKKETDKITKRVDGEVRTIHAQLAAQKTEYTTMGTSLQQNIDTANDHINQVESDLKLLRDKVERGNKALDEIETKLRKLTARSAEAEQALFNSLRGRVQEACAKTSGLLSSTGAVKDLVKNLGANVEKMSIPETYQNDSVRFEEESKKLFSMLEFETSLRVGRADVGLVDNNSFALGEILRHIRRDILALSTLAGGDYEDIVPKSVVNELLALVDSAHTTLDSIYETVSTANSLWSHHDNILGSKWNVLAGMAEAVKNVSGIADVIKALESTVSTKTNSDDVAVISTAIFNTAIEPVNAKIDENDRKDTIAIAETKESVSSVENALKSGLDRLESSLVNKLSQVAAQASQAAQAAHFAAHENSESHAPIAIQGAAATLSHHSSMNFNLAEIEQDLEPMIKGIVEAYVINNPSISLSRGGNRAGHADGYFAIPPAVIPTSLEEDSFSFFAHELEVVFDSPPKSADHNAAPSAEQKADELSDELPDESNRSLGVGSLVKVKSASHEHFMSHGIVVGLDAVTAATGTEETAASANQNDSKAASRKYRVAITPKTPMTAGLGNESRSLDFEGFQSLSTAEEGRVEVPAAARAHGTGGIGSNKAMADMLEQIHLMSRKIDDIVSGRIGTTAAPANTSGSSSPTFGGRLNRASPSSGPSVSDTQIVELVQESMKVVAAEIGDVRESTHRDLEQVRKQLKQAILTAINKAITEQAEKDKPSMLTTKSLCMGCGRTALVRGAPFDQSLVSKGFNPALNANIGEGPDIYRGGFRMPVSKSQTLSRMPQPTLGLNEESLFEDSQDTRGMQTHTTYSEILAHMTREDPSASVQRVTDMGPGGMSISITSTTLPVRQLSTTAKNIRHAQGKEEAAMLRPIHRKGMPGKVSEKARSFVGKTWAPERFGDELNLSPSAQAIKIPSIARAEMARMSMSANALAQGSVESKFHP